jgi:hypothetical protein
MVETEGSGRSARSKSGGTKSRARYFGIVAAFSARTRWRFWCRRMRVRSIARIGVSEIDIRATGLSSGRVARPPRKVASATPVDLAGCVVKGRLSRLGTLGFAINPPFTMKILS